MLQKIEAVLDEKVRPVLAGHGGNILVQGYEDGVLRVRLTGACSGCYLASSTRRDLVEAELKRAIPDIREVLLVDEIDPDMLNFARRILRQENQTPDV